MLGRMRKTIVACLAAGAVGVGASLALSTDVGVPVSASQAKLEAMKVELAWLADAQAFNLTLQVVPTADGLELKGQVPDDATRQHVLKLARQACYLPVRDALEVGKPCLQPGPPRRRPPPPSPTPCPPAPPGSPSPSSRPAS